MNQRLLFLAVRTGLEPATPCVTGMYSNQLNYRTITFILQSLSDCDAKVYIILNLAIVSRQKFTSDRLFFYFCLSYK